MSADSSSTALTTSSEWRPLPARAGLTAAIASGGLAACAILAWLYILSQPAGIGSLIALLIGVSAGVLAVAMAVFAFGYYSLRYRLETDRLVISCLWIREFVPFGQIEGINSGKRMGAQAVVEGISWQGLGLGRLSRTELADPRIYSSTMNAQSVLIIAVPHRSYVLSPADLEVFRTQLIDRLEQLSEEDIEGTPAPSSEGTLLPFASVLSDRLCLALVGASLLALLVSFVYVAIKLPGLPSWIALHYNAVGLPDFVVSRTDAYRLPFIGTLVLAANVVSVAAVHWWERNAGRVLAAGTLFVQIVALVSLWRVVQ